MTSKDSSLKNKPFLLKPVGKDYLWGGTRLNDDYSKSLPLQPLAETWECSTHQDGQSLVASGEFKGKTLRAVLKEQPEFLGKYANYNGDLPIMIKLIDAKKDLSVQVHPDDAYARKYEHGQNGKTEMWYVMAAAKKAEIVYGFAHDMERDLLAQSLRCGDVEKYLQKVLVRKDDVFLIAPGRVHAIGAGVLIAEIQQSSNLTYRLFDYNRLDKNGKKRELHIEKALAVVDLQASDKPKQPLRVLRYKCGYASELLCTCKYFQVERILINTERCRKMAVLPICSESFQVFLCTNGCGTMMYEDDILQFFKGDCIFVPASALEVRVHGRMQALWIKG